MHGDDDRLLLVSLLWAYSFGLIKRHLAGLDASFVAFARMALSLLVFLPFLRFAGLKICGTAFAFANVHYGLQVAWYILCGSLGLATRYVSFHDLWQARKTGDGEQN